MSQEDLTKEIRRLDSAISQYIRPDTFPLALRMLAPGEPVPEGARIPSHSVKEQWIVCQAIGVARRYGWSIAVGREDVICPLAAIAFGFRAPNDEYLRGRAALGMYGETEEASSLLEAQTWKFPTGSYDYVCVAPLARTNFEPHVIAVYANSAQVMRLVNAALFKKGGRLQSTTGGRLDCADIVIQTMSTDEPKVIIPCNGDRVFGMTQDAEMIFTFPWHCTGEILTGLEGTQKGGVRYPIPVAMRETVTMPPHYQDIMAHLNERDQTAGAKGTKKD